MIFALLLFLSSDLAQAFPEMVRHHYVNCNTCHVSPGGGGLLTEYGRGMASEMLSTWSYENEALFLHGLIKPEHLPKSLHLGGDIRSVQVHRESRQRREGRYILMQTSFEGGYTLGPVTAVAAFGKPDRNNHLHGGFTRFYLLAQVEETVQFRVGRFLPPFGLLMADHTLPTRGGIGFGQESERNAVEAHWSAEAWHAAFSVSQSRIPSLLRDEERAASFQLEHFIADSHRIGFSLWNGESPNFERWLWSVHGILGFSEKFYTLTETTWQSKRQKTPGAARETGIYHFARMGYEQWKGVHLLVVENLSKTNITAPSSFSLGFGPGLVWYPRPHLELEVTYKKQKNLRVSREFEDHAYLMMHYYL